MLSSPTDDPKVLAVAYAKVKVEWAKNHISGVERLVEAVTSRSAQTVRAYQDMQTGLYRLYIGPKDGGVPVNLPLHLGDAIHNLNGVMDYLWSGLARAVNPELGSKVTFPRDETRQNLVKRLANPRGYNAAIKEAFKDIDAFVLNVVQPFKGGDGAIWSLNKLDNINKHRLILPTTNIIEFRRDLVARSQDGGTVIHRAGVRIQTDGPSLSIGFRTPFEFNDDAEPVLGVIFPPDDPFGGEPVAETLVNLTQTVTEIIKAFEEAFVGGPVRVESTTDKWSVN